MNSSGIYKKLKCPPKNPADESEVIHGVMAAAKSKDVADLINSIVPDQEKPGYLLVTVKKVPKSKNSIQEDKNNKAKLRDEFFKKMEDVKVINIDNEMRFYVETASLRKNPEIIANIQQLNHKTSAAESEVIPGIQAVAKSKGIANLIDSIIPDHEKPGYLLVTVKRVPNSKNSGHEDKNNKAKLRDEFFKKMDDVKVINIESTMRFYIEIDSLRKNPEIIANSCQFTHTSKLTENITMLDNGVPVGIVKINVPFDDGISLNRFDIDGEKQGKGYGTRLMGYLFDFCLERGCDLRVDVDKKRADNDDPLKFYTKVCERNKIPFIQDNDQKSHHFNAQCYISIKLEDMVSAKYGKEFEASGLAPHQFLAMKRCNLSHEQATNPKFERTHYRAMVCGLKYDEIIDCDKYLLKTALINRINIQDIKDFSKEQRILLEKSLNGTHKNTYSNDAYQLSILINAIKDLDKLQNNHNCYYLEIAFNDLMENSLTPKQLENGEAKTILEWMTNQPDSFESRGLWCRINNSDLLNESSRNKLSELTDKEIGIISEYCKKYANNTNKKFSVSQMLAMLPDKEAQEMKKTSGPSMNP